MFEISVHLVTKLNYLSCSINIMSERENSSIVSLLFSFFYTLPHDSGGVL